MYYYYIARTDIWQPVVVYPSHKPEKQVSQRTPQNLLNSYSFISRQNPSF